MIDGVIILLVIVSVALIRGGGWLRVWHTIPAGVMILAGIFMWLYIGSVVLESIVGGFLAMNAVFLAVMFMLRD